MHGYDMYLVLAENIHETKKNKFRGLLLLQPGQKTGSSMHLVCSNCLELYCNTRNQPPTKVNDNQKVWMVKTSPVDPGHDLAYYMSCMYETQSLVFWGLVSGSYPSFGGR